MAYPKRITCFLSLLLLPFLLRAGSLEDDILKYTNQYRASQGKPALRSSVPAEEQAMKHSSNMARHKTAFGHNGFNDRVAGVKKELGRVSAAAENVAYGDLDARQVVQGWIKSKMHRKNMLGDYTLIGIGTAKDKNGVRYFTQLFIKP